MRLTSKTATAIMILLSGCQGNEITEHESKGIEFVEITDEIGLKSVPTWKYGGPAIADLNHDGHYEFLLTNHHIEPAQLFWGQKDGNIREHNVPIAKFDVHGIAPGDYDGDGDNDVLVSLGGGNGSKPQPPRLLRNDDGKFVDVTDEVGIAHLGARGRSVRWVDMDLDGDLDFLQINARQVVGEDMPRNILFENLGDGSFKYREGGEFENIEAERVLLTDFNNDHITDLILFSPLSIWQGQTGFGFEEVTEAILPENVRSAEHVMAVADADIDNDGDLDLYIARGKTYYEIANNSYHFDRVSGRLDIRDEGNKGHDGIGFLAGEEITLSDFSHWARGTNMTFPVYLGADKTVLDVPPLPDGYRRDSGKVIEGVPSSPVMVPAEAALGFPETFKENGWYLGYIGNGQWRMEWHLDANLAWDIRASIQGVSRVRADWQPQKLDVPDLLLKNDGGQFIDISQNLPVESRGNNWGVTNGDFNNDGLSDFFVFRFGELRKRVQDALMVNQGDMSFLSNLVHGANVLDQGGHGDMGAAFDYDFDGRVDLLSGDDDDGRWHLYKNETEFEGSNYALFRIGYSTAGVDPYAAEITIKTPNKTLFKRIGSAGAVHSQSQLNIVHFGLGDDEKINSVNIRWRTGEEIELDDAQLNQLISVGKFD
ncbi:CRTAC1 family protein [Hirschia maritima]|uniref:CRTAC1 family protein n=1 Tax=Hirschia maritima TaxID=1121961 RepID=UPI000364A23D|nr:CRTAC1 family protein [Hirschia maritima]